MIGPARFVVGRAGHPVAGGGRGSESLGSPRFGTAYRYRDPDSALIDGEHLHPLRRQGGCDEPAQPRAHRGSKSGSTAVGVGEFGVSPLWIVRVVVGRGGFG
ncbi:hypothetical protein D5S19_05240 [Amycolatopsis panacis]|uniref:Uncharacterized protein n=1 Tax=Amycolatopsis panacis TaxID=2340917 RepID=A0A419I973_9PSEU|nr:hypothetical protein D5S19_05240 [Amycolatopsis panacis]